VIEGEMGGACGTYEGEKKCVVFRSGNLKERGHLEDLAIRENKILKCGLMK
jgi:hypothetical protein